MMNDIFYTELRRRSEELRSSRISLPGKNQYKDFFRGLSVITEMASKARSEGLLALEENEEIYAHYPLGTYLTRLVQLIVDGTDKKLVEEMGMALYFSAGFKSAQGLLFLLYLQGFLAIQDNENPLVIENRLGAMLPDKVMEQYREKRTDEAEKEAVESNQKTGEDLLEELYRQKCPVSQDHEYYLIFKMAEYAFISMDDRSIQRFLRDVDNCDLAIFLKGQSGASCQAIMNNLSRRLSIMIAEDMDFMGSVRLKDIADATRKILRTLFRLMNAGEIVCTGGEDYLTILYKIYCDDPDKDPTGEAQDTHTQSELEELFSEYMESLDKMV